MFAPKVAKPQEKAASDSTRAMAHQRSALATNQFGYGPVEQARFPEPTFAGQGALPQEAEPEGMTAREAPRRAAWNFCRVPVFDPDRTGRAHTLPIPHGIQPKLAIGEIDDPLEREADAVAENVMRMPAGGAVAGACTCTPGGEMCEECQKKQLQGGNLPIVQRRGKASGTATSDAPSIVHQTLGSSGRSLDSTARSDMESRFGNDFGDVRIHTDGQAAESAKSINALAYTVGRDIVFGEGQYAPHADASRHLLAHELAHVVLGHRGMRRQAAEAAPSLAAEISLQGTDAQNIVDVMAAVDGLRAGEKPNEYTTTFKGRVIRMDQQQRDRLVGQARASLRNSLINVRNMADYARSGYEIQKKVNEESPVTSFVVTTFAGVRDKPAELLKAAARADGLAAEAQGALAKNAYVTAGQKLSEAELEAKKAKRLWQEYHGGIISAGEKTITVLEYTRDASFLTLGVLAIIATGGAAAGAAGAAGTTTTAFGVEVGTVGAAQAISVGAPIAATLGGAGVQLALGDKVDWGRVALDIIVNLVLAKFGGKLSQGLFSRMVGNAAVASLGKVAFGRIVSSLLTHEASVVFTTIVDQAYQELRYKNVTWDQFTDRLIDRMADPKGLIVATVMGTVATAAEAKYGGSRLTEITDKGGSPTGEFDLIRGGTIHEDKSALGLNTINPKTNRPYPGSDETTWAQKQIHDKTVVRIQNLQAAAATRAAKGGSQSFPTVKEVRNVRRYEFVIDADTPTLRTQVEAQLVQLRAKFPDWKFSARYGK